MNDSFHTQTHATDATQDRYHPDRLPVVIFCGGHGTRLKEETQIIPKPLVPIGDRPILWHIMKMYYAQGFRKFILLTGYKGEQIKNYFYQYPIHMSDFTVRYNRGTREVAFHTDPEENWEVTVLDTGLNAETGARLFRARSFLEKGPFMLTYGDGVSDVDLHQLIAFHKTHQPVVTLTGVHPPGRFGEIRTEGPMAASFWEKPNRAEGYINGGFMIVEPEIFRYMHDGELLNFEKNVLPDVARDRRMGIFPHHGFWQCMDTLRDMEKLTSIWKSEEVPWRIWEQSPAKQPASSTAQTLTEDANKRILVTGGAGFLGANLVKTLLDRGADVTVLDIKPNIPDITGHYRDAKRARYVCGDIADVELVDSLIKEGNFDTVYHLAAEPIVQRFHLDPASGLETNVKGTWVLLDAIRRHTPDTIIVMASSDKAYGTHEQLPYDESAPLQGRNPYDCSKSCADLIGHMYAHAYGMRLIVTRCGNIYGGGDLNFSRLIPDVIRHAVWQKPFVLRSDGKFLRDFLHVDDAVSAYLACAQALRNGHKQGEAYNFSHDAPLSVLEVIKRIHALMGLTDQQLIIENKANYEIRDQYLDSRKARDELRWNHQVLFDEGLQRTIDWYRMLLERHPEYAAS